MAEMDSTSLTPKTLQTQVQNMGSSEWLDDIRHNNTCKNSTFFFSYPEPLHLDVGHSSVNDTDTESVTEALFKLLAGINCDVADK